MSTISSLTTEQSFSRTYCSQQSPADRTYPEGSITAVTERVGQILTKNLLCRHDTEALLFCYKTISRLEVEGYAHPEGETSSLGIIQKVQNRIRLLLALPQSRATATDLINLYHLSRFSPICPPDTSILGSVLRKRRAAGISFDAQTVADQLPYCISARDFLEDLKQLTGMDQQDPLLENLAARPTDILLRDARLREKRERFLAHRDSDTYPKYLDVLLEGGFLHLYDHLLSTIEGSGSRGEIATSDAFYLSRIVLETRNVIVQHVGSAIEQNRLFPGLGQNVIFLAGNTGAGKTTLFSCLRGDSLKRKDNNYEVEGQNIIGHEDTVSCTFLPNVSCVEENIYVDLIGFNDTRGELINLGFELAFKALVDCYNPKVVIVEPINAIEESKGANVKRLVKKLRGILGGSYPFLVFFTKYPHLIEFVNLESAIEREKRLDRELQCLRDDSKKIEKLEEKIRKLRKKREDEGALNRLEEKLLRSRLQNLSNLKRGGESLENDIRSKSEEIETCREHIRALERAIEAKRQKILRLMENDDNEYRLVKLPYVELRYLENRNTLLACREALSKAQSVKTSLNELSTSDRSNLVKAFKRAFVEGKLPLPPTLEIVELEHRILETSLIDVLTTKTSPEVGKFLHLPEMDPTVIEEIDQFLVKRFTDALTRLIVIGPLEQKTNETNVRAFIKEEILTLEKKQDSKAAGLTHKWEALEQRIKDVSRTREKEWEALESTYQSHAKEILSNLDGDKKAHLKSWDQWAAQLFGAWNPLMLPKQIYANRAQQSANEDVAKKIEEAITDLNASINRIGELHETIENKKEIVKCWERCKISPQNSNNWLDRIGETIELTKNSYNSIAKPSETWGDRLEMLRGKLHIQKDLWCVMQQHPLLVGLMRVGLCSQTSSNFEFLAQIASHELNDRQARLGLGLDNLKALEAKRSLLATMLEIAEKESRRAAEKTIQELMAEEYAWTTLLKRNAIEGLETATPLTAIVLWLALMEPVGFEEVFLGDSLFSAAKSLISNRKKENKLKNELFRNELINLKYEMEILIKLTGDLVGISCLSTELNCVRTQTCSKEKKEIMLELLKSMSEANTETHRLLQVELAANVLAEGLVTKGTEQTEIESATCSALHVAKAIRQAELLILQSAHAIEMPLLERVRLINRGLAGNIGLDLNITLHRIFFMNLLSRERIDTIPSSTPLEKSQRKFGSKGSDWCVASL